MNIKIIKKNLLLLAIVIISLLYCLVPTTMNSVFASSVDIDYTQNYTNVLDDLQKDNSFNANDYVVDMQDYTLKVIQIAESENQELFVYVYQSCSPNTKLIATSINISQNADVNNPSYRNYKLTLLNNENCLYKYKVENLVVSADSIRYYDISSIFRKWYSEYDEGLSQVNDNTISEVAFVVATRFTARYDSNGILCYSNSGVEVITIIEKYNGYLRYTNGTVYNMEDRFFTAFSCDRPIDKLIEADVQFIRCTYTNKIDMAGMGGGTVVCANGNSGLTATTLASKNTSNKVQLMSNSDLPYGYSYGDNITENKTLSCDTSVEIQVGWIFTQKYSWTEIQSATSFITDHDLKLSDTAKSNLQNKDWVLNYYTAEYKEEYDMLMMTPLTKYEKGTRVRDVTILRLKYETNGKVYNLGVVDNKSTGSTEMAGTNVNLLDKISAWVKSILAIIMLILVIVVVSPFLPTILSFVWWLIKLLFKIVIWIISLPIKIIQFIFNKKE